MPKVLAVIDQQQHPPAGHRIGNGVDQRRVALRRDAEHPCQGGRHGGRVTDPGQLDDPDAIVEFPRKLGANLDGQAGLAYTTHTAEGDQSLRPHKVADFVDIGVAPDQGADPVGQVPGEAVDAAQYGELGGEPVGHHLEYRGRPAEPAQEMVTQGAHDDPAAHQDLSRVGHEHLAAVSQGHKPRRSIHFRAVVVPVQLHGLAGVQRHPDGEVNGVVANQLPLCLDSGRHGGHR